MANGKLSEQVTKTDTLPSRTERRRQEALRRSDAVEQSNFERLQAQAQDLQKTEFSNITTPEEYRQKYNSLSPDLQQFFLSPSEIDQKFQESRDPAVKQKIDANQERLRELQAQLDSLNQRIAETKRQTGERPRFLVNELNNVGREIDDLRRQNQILEKSSTEDEAIQNLQLYKRQSLASYTQDQERQKSGEINKILREAEQKGYSFIKVEESKEGVPLGRKIFAVTPSGEYKLVSESKASNSGLTPSTIPKANIREVIKIGNTEVTFEGVQDLYKTAKGKLATAFGSFNLDEAEFVKADEKARKEEAEKFLDEKQYSPVINVEENQKKSIFSKILRQAKILYISSPFGITSPVEREDDVQRKFFSIGGTASFPKFQFESLDTKTAERLVDQTERDGKVAQEQVKAVIGLNTLIEGTPDELKYDVQQAGLERLRNIGVNYVVDEETGELVFTSREITPRKSFAGIELGRSTGIRKVGVAASVIGVKGLEFFGAGELIGVGFNVIKAGYTGIRTGVGLQGLKLGEISVKGGRFVGEAEVLEGTAGKGILKRIGKNTVLAGLGGLYVAGKVSQYYDYRDLYGGSTGRELFVLETAGEVAGFGTLVTRSALENREVRRLNEQIKVANFQKEIKFQRLLNIRDFGQFSSKARVEFRELGTGRTVLTRSEKEILQGIYVKQAGVSEAEASKLIREGAVFEQKLIVDSPADFETFTSRRFGVLSSFKTDEGFREIGIEFTKRGRRITNPLLKTTTGTGQFSLTSVFEKTRRSKELREVLKFDDLSFIKETPSRDQFRLKDVIISKIEKQSSGKVGETRVSLAKIENRLFKSLVKSKDRTTVEESLRLGTPKYSEDDLAKLFEGSGISSKTSPRSQNVIRIEKDLFRKQGILKVNTDEEFEFAAFGTSGRQRSLRNIFRKLDFTDLENALRSRKPKNTPFSATFGEEEIKGTTVREIERQITEQRTAPTKQISRSKVNVLPTTAEFKIVTRTRSVQELKSEISVITKSGVSVKDAVKDLLGLGSASKLSERSIVRERSNTALKSNQALKELLKQEQRQRTRQVPQSRTQTDLRLERITFIPQPTITDTPTFRPPRIALGLGKENKRIKNILKLKQILKEDELAFFPTFSAKALDIPAIEVSEKEAVRLIKQIRTGFEVTGGIRIRK